MFNINKITKTIIFIIVVMTTGLFAQNYALDFDGTDDYVNCGNGGSLDITTDITIELWFYADSWTEPIGSAPGLISKRDTFSDMDWELFYGSEGMGNEIKFWYGNGGTNNLFTNSNVNPSENTWHHIAVTRSGSDWTLYLDGVVGATETNSNPIPTGDSLRIGKLGGDIGDSECFQGKIDEVRIWNAARTQQQIQDNMYNSLIGNESNLVTYYQMNSGSGNELTDNSQNTNTGTLHNMDDSDWITDYLIPEGNGTVDDPYLIATLANLNWLSEDNSLWEYCYEQTADIDASTTINWNSGEGFSPIGSGPSFKGIYDGKEYTIDGLYISRPTNWQGLFGTTLNAMISNVGLTNVNITGASEVGGLVGSNNYQSRIHNCYCTGSVTGYSKVGGLIGYNNYQSYIIYCYSEGSVYGEMSEVGGLIGSLDHGPMGIYYCYSNSSVTGVYNTGGLIGFANSSNDANIMSCYSRGNVTCLNFDGNAAFLGNSGIFQTNIYYGYSTGSVTFTDASNPTDRGFVGNASGGFYYSFNFWDTETSMQTTGLGATGKTTIEMKTESTFTDAGWDFDSTWDMSGDVNDGYPYLIVEPSSSPFAFAIEDTTNEDVPISITLLGFDPDGDDLTFSIYEHPDNGILSGTAPNIIYTANTDWFGIDTFQYEVNDGTNDDYAEVIITVEAVNDPPVADNLEISTNENTAIEFTLTGSDADGDELTFAVVTAPVNGTYDGTTYTPNTGWFGVDSFTYVANDGTVDSAPATVTITVNALNTAPIADDISVTTDEDVAVAITMTGSDADGDALTFAVVTAPVNGTYDGTTYAPNANFNGSDSFTYVANDGTVDSDPATVSITINAPYTGPIWYISTTGSDTNDGSAENPFATIQAGLNAASSSDIVQVSAGTYVENITWPATNGIQLIGEDRETTIIDGDSLASVIRFENTLGGIIDTTTLISGFTITNGSADNGGGIFCGENSSPSLTNVTISNNSTSGYGGGICCGENSSPSLTNVTISGNSAYGGGGIYCVFSSPSLVDVTISDNSSNFGGGIYCDFNSIPSLENVTITGNSADAGGGIFCFSSSPSLANVTITDNSAYGAGDITGGGGIYCYDNSNPSLANVTISGNSAYGGGGIYCVSSSPSLENVTISNNSAFWGGGIVCYYNSSPSLVDVTISGNSVSHEEGVGGGIACVSSSPSLVNCILWNDAPQEIHVNADNFNPGSVNIFYSDIQGGEAGIVTNDNGTVYWGEGNIDLDPLFVDAENGDYHLTENSPCIDAGTAFFVFEGDTLVDMSEDEYVGSAPDMGAFEVVFVNNPPIADDISVFTDEDVAVAIELTGSDADGDSLTFAVVDAPTSGQLVENTGSSLGFDGAGDYVETTLGDLSGSAITIEYWFKGSYIQSAVRHQGSEGFIVSGWSEMHIISTDGGTGGISIGDGVYDNNWHHVAMAWEQNTTNGFKSYLDGELIEQRTSSDTPLPNISANVFLGSFIGTSEFLNGNLDEVRIWNIARTQEEIQSSMSSELIGDESGLVAYWSLNENSGVTVNDMSGNGYSGELYGDAAWLNDSPFVVSEGGPNYTYTPNANWFGTDSFTYVANDGTVDSEVAIVTITVNSINDAPVVDDMQFTMMMNETLDIALIGTDVENDDLTFEIVTPPNSGTYVDGVYSPNTNFIGSDSFTYKANDGTTDSNIGSVGIAVEFPLDTDLPAYMVLDAGSPEVNGTYVYNHSVNDRNHPVWAHVDGVFFLHTDSNEWGIIDDDTDMDDDDAYYLNDTQNPLDPIVPPSTGWYDEEGNSPGPMIIPAGNSLFYDTELFTESSENDGTIVTTITIDFFTTDSETFTGSNGDDFVSDGKIIVSNVPAGLTAVVTRSDELTLVVALTGSAISHTNLNDVSDLTLTFQNSAFSDGDASDVFFSSKDDFSVNFVQHYYVASSGGDFTLIADALAACGDGDVITLAAETFTELGVLVDKSVTIQGQGAGETIVQAHALVHTATDRVFKIEEGYLSSGDYTLDVLIQDLTIQNGVASQYDDGGGVYVGHIECVTFKNVNIKNNRVNPPSGYGRSGGGIFKTIWDGQLILENCTLSGNSHYAGGSGTSYGGAMSANGNVSITNCTFTDNSCSNADYIAGGAIRYNGNENYSLSIINSTISGNSSGIAVNYGNVEVKNTIVSGNNNKDFETINGMNPIDLGYNIIGYQTVWSGSPTDWQFDNATSILYNYTADGTASSQWTRGNVVMSNQNLDLDTTLAYNGTLNGTQTIALLDGSFAIDAGTDEGAPETDQRGFNRNGVTDIGAYEFGGILNTAPVAQNLAYLMDEDSTLEITLSGSDAEGDVLTYFLHLPELFPEHGTLSGDLPNLTYTPDADWFGVDGFYYYVSDGMLDSEIALVQIVVNDVIDNTPPIANGMEVETDEDTAVEIILTADDAEGDSLTFFIVEEPIYGTLSGDAPNLTYTPNADYFGYDTFSFIANDGEFDSPSPAYVTITVNSVIDLGDVNFDGVVNVQDVILTVNFALGMQTPTDDQQIAADMNEDGNINVMDVVLIVNLALGIEVAKLGDSEAMLIIQGDKITIESESEIAGVQLDLVGVNDFVSGNVSYSSFVGLNKRVLFVNTDGTPIPSGFLLSADGLQGIENVIIADRSGEVMDITIIVLPTEFGLSQNYPNPFNPTTTINYQLPVNSNVSLQIYNIRGQLMATLLNGEMEAGYHEIQWNGQNALGQPVSSGVYFYRILVETNGHSSFQETHKMVLLQ